MDKFTPLSELNLVLIGNTKTGKSSCGNTILGRDCFKTQTQTVSSNKCEVGGKILTVLDTPGSFCVTSDLFKSSSVFLSVVNISSAFRYVHLKALMDQVKAVGRHFWSKTVVLFSFGDCLGDTTTEQRIESEGGPLQRLIQRCGNRYHVLDNKKTCKNQVKELIWLIEEMMAGERLAVFQNGDRMTIEIPQRQQELEAVKAKYQPQSSPDLEGSAGAGTSEMVVSERTRQMRHIRERHSFMSFVGSLPNGKHRLFWTEAGHMLAVHPPVWTFGEDLQENMRFCNEIPTNSAMVLFLPHAQSCTEVNPVHSLCRPMLINRTLTRLTEYGGLQNIIEQWGDSSLEELEAFIDLYFEMLWERTMGSCLEAEQENPTRVEEEDMLANINQKLSKLDALEEIKEDLAELKKSMERSVKTIEELRGETKKEQF